MTRSRQTFDIAELVANEFEDISDPVLSWVVNSEDDRTLDFIVDLGRLAYGASHPHPNTRISGGAGCGAQGAVTRSSADCHHGITLAIAPSFREWSEKRKLRTVSETLSSFRFFFTFLKETPYAIPPTIRPKEIAPELYLQLFDEEIGLFYSEWLRTRRMSDGRRAGLYAATKSLLERATGLLMWRANPFSSEGPLATDESDESDDRHRSYSIEKLSALNNILKNLLRQKESKRTEMLKITDIGTRREFHAQLSSGDSFNGDGVRDYARVVLTDEESTCASYLLTLELAGCNEQPLLDANPGHWSNPNPFDDESRLIRLEKSRAGGGRADPLGRIKRTTPIRVIFPSKRKPRFHPYKLLRRQEQLSKLLRVKLKRAAKSNKGEIKRLSVKSRRLWLYVNSSGSIDELTGNRIHAVMNKFLANLAEDYPLLRDGNGKPIRYYARGFRNAYFQFVNERTSFDERSGEAALSHALESRATWDYLQRAWARKYVRREHRHYMHGAFGLLRDPDADLSPVALRNILNDRATQPRDLSKPIPVPKRYKDRQAAHGLYCKDPFAPPADVYVPEAPGDICPAKMCWDCAWGRCFDESLPELAFDILLLRRMIDEVGSHLTDGSSLHEMLSALEEMFHRWPESKRATAMASAREMPFPL